MSDDCIDIERIADVMDLSAEDPRRRHMETCPRCNAILASYRAFMKQEFVEGSDTEDARARLTSFLASRIGTMQEKVEFELDAKKRGRKGLFRRFVQTLAMRPAWVAALLVVIAAAALLWHPWTTKRIVLRSPISTETSLPLTLSAPQKLSGGAIRLEWTPIAGADSYQVRLYDIELNLIYSIEPTSATTLVIERSLLPADIPNELIWRVVALHRGDEIAWSDPGYLELK